MSQQQVASENENIPVKEEEKEATVLSDEESPNITEAAIAVKDWLESAEEETAATAAELQLSQKHQQTAKSIHYDTPRVKMVPKKRSLSLQRPTQVATVQQQGDSIDQELFDSENSDWEEHHQSDLCEETIDDTVTVSNPFSSKRGQLISARNQKLIQENKELVLYLCENKAFNEGEATRLLCSTPEGITIQFQRNFGERLKTALYISQILVFQETAKSRLERCKRWQLRKDVSANDHRLVNDSLEKLEDLLRVNRICPWTFAKITCDHFYGNITRKNNLFFYGLPSTGKTMIMDSLVQLHYNYTKLAGLSPNSAFNFASLVHSNACFMDECKLTENQFEQWKLLAAGQPMPTDVKYKNRHDVTNCVLYTASTYQIGANLTTSENRDAIDARTMKFDFVIPAEWFKLNAFVWEEFWKKYDADRL